jgi:glutamate synthase (NADPH/NADH) small chain
MPVATGEETIFEVDMVIKAAGQMPFTSLVAESGLPHVRGLVAAKGEDGSAGLAPVFAGGDCVNGGKEVVDAVQAGKEAAAAILTYFEKS